MGINAGPGRGVKLLQSAIGCVADGVIGPRTMELIKSADVTDLIKKYSDARRDYYKSLKTFSVFGKGWLARVDREEKEALEMAKNG
jgi:lysozyme family protein